MRGDWPDLGCPAPRFASVVARSSRAGAPVTQETAGQRRLPVGLCKALLPPLPALAAKTAFPPSKYEEGGRGRDAGRSVFSAYTVRRLPRLPAQSRVALGGCGTAAGVGRRAC